MIREKIKHNDNVSPNDRELHKLKKEFPQYFDKDGSFLLDRFSNMLKDKDIDIEKEGYELKFLGKSYAKYLTSTESMTVLTPDIEHNMMEENKNSENLYIVGDNLDAIKHLLGSYSNKIKCIYIDPPYNTGSDGFVYPDDFKFTKESLSKAIGIEEDEAERILNIAGKSTHSAWMTFMYPRLMLALDLLSDDGVIFISIDDNEQANLKLMCDEVFGEGNFIGNFIWQKTYSTKNNNKYISEDHDYILSYAKNIEGIESFNRLNRTKESDQYYKFDDGDGRGLYRLDNITAQGQRGYDVYYNGKIYKEPYPSGWRFTKEKMYELIEDRRIFLPDDEGKRPQVKRYLSEQDGLISKTILPFSLVGHTDSANRNLFKLLGDKLFDYPKPIELIKYLCSLISKADSVILDFFSGSATTAHAVMELNAEDNGNRKYIMIQLPETIEKGKSAYEAGYRTIDQIGRARIEKAAKKIKEETKADIDYGYKLYRLNELSDKTLDKIVEFNPHETLILEDMRDVFKFNDVEGRETILSTWINMDGYGLSHSPVKIKLNQYEADLMKDSLYIIDLGIMTEDIIELIKKVEDNALNISRIVLYPYSVEFNVLHELKKNIINLRNKQNINVIERY